jgi:hypothetical protein
MKSSAYTPTLSDAHLKRIDTLKQEGKLNEKQIKKLEVLTMTHAGEKRETIAEKLGINMDTITEWKKLFVKEGMEVYLGLQKAVSTAKRNVKKVQKRVSKTVKGLEKKVATKLTPSSAVKSQTTEKAVMKPSVSVQGKGENGSISKIEQYIVEVLKNSYASVAQAIQTYSQSHGTETKKKILKTYKKELKKAKEIIKEWTKKVEELKKDMHKKDKKEEKNKKEKKDRNKDKKNKKDKNDKKNKKNSK